MNKLFQNSPLRGTGWHAERRWQKQVSAVPAFVPSEPTSRPQHRKPTQMRSCLVSRASLVMRREGPSPVPIQGPVGPRVDAMCRTRSSSQPSGEDAEPGSVPRKRVLSPECWLFPCCAFFQTDRSQHPTAPEVAEPQGRALETPRLSLGSCSRASGSPGQTTSHHLALV